MQVSDNLDDLEQEKERFINEVDILCQKQKELQNLVEGMEKIFSLPDYLEAAPLEIREPATSGDIQRQNM